MRQSCVSNKALSLLCTPMQGYPIYPLRNYKKQVIGNPWQFTSLWDLFWSWFFKAEFLCSSSCPVDQAGLELETPACCCLLRSGTKGVHHRHMACLPSLPLTLKLCKVLSNLPWKGSMFNRKDWFESQLSVTNYMILAKAPNHCKPQFLHC